MSRRCPTSSSPGGRRPSSTRSIRGPSPTLGRRRRRRPRGRSGRGSTTSSGWGSTPSGCRRSTGRRWRTSATTSATTATSIRCSARWTTSTASSRTPTPADIRVLVDFVPNHTSDQHPWFRRLAVVARRTQRDWYVWRDPAPDGGPPNNWVAAFAGRTGVDPRRGHRAVLPAPLPARAARPELANPAVEAAMHDVVRFWLDRGVDGLRRRRGPGLGKDPALADDPAGAGGRSPRADQRPTRDPRLPPSAALAARRVPGRADDGRRGVPARHPPGGAVLRRRRRAASVVQLPAAVRALGRRALAASRSRPPPRCSTPSTRGRPGSCRTTTTPVTAPATARRPGPGPRPCCCSGSAARRSCTPARSSACSTPRSPPSGSSTPADGTAAGPRSRGIPTHGHGWPVRPWLPFPPETDSHNVADEWADPGSTLGLYQRCLAGRAGIGGAPGRRPAPGGLPRGRARLGAGGRRGPARRCS